MADADRVRPAPRLSTAPSWEALRGYATLMRGVLDALPFGVAVLDRGGTLTTWNNELASMLPSPPSRGGTHDISVLVRQVHRIVADPQDFDARLKLALEPPKSNEEGETLNNEFEVALHGEDGGALAVSVNPFGDEDESIVICFRDATGELRARRALEHRAMHDALTKLPNRELLMDRLTVALARLGRQGTAVGVLFIDLDGFKSINDTFGHDAGDEVLLNSAHRMRSQLRPQDTVARLGGDEFAICAQRITVGGLAHLALRLEAVLDEPHQIHGREVVVGGSIGIHFAAAGESVSEAIHLADQAMYAVKASRHDRGTVTPPAHPDLPLIA